MNSLKTTFVIIAIAAVLSVAMAPTMMNTAMADDHSTGKETLMTNQVPRMEIHI